MKSLYSKKEEFLNYISHMIGVILVLIGYIALIILNQDKSLILPITVYMFGLFIMFLASSIYHGAKNEKFKGVAQKLDHAAIYIVIPSCFILFIYKIIGGYGYFVLLGMYLISLIGIILKLAYIKKFSNIHLAFYLIEGWCAVIFIKPMIEYSFFYFILTLLGGILYSIGVYFYKQKGKEYFHFIWHIFILLAAITQFIANCYLIFN